MDSLFVAATQRDGNIIGNKSFNSLQIRFNLSGKNKWPVGHVDLFSDMVEKSVHKGMPFTDEYPFGSGFFGEAFKGMLSAVAFFIYNIRDRVP